MNEQIKLILSLSLSGSILAGIVIVMKPFIKHKLSRSIQYYIWIVVLLRLLIPFSIEDSIMNKVFYGNQTSIVINAQDEYRVDTRVTENTSNSFIMPSVKQNVNNGVYNTDVDHRRYFRDLFNQYAFYIWLFVAILVFSINLTNYIRFTQKLKLTNQSATEDENIILNSLVDGQHNIKLVRNPLVSTPMLIGIFRPCIIIPDMKFNKKQFRYILLHELTHLKRYDILIKWLTMLVTSLHWFNPFIYFIKREINHTCELACDEVVIRRLNCAEKQAYGDTLISVASEMKYPMGVMQTTMSEGKKTLKERLVSIMKYNKKSKLSIIISALLFIVIILGAIALGASVGTNKEKAELDLDTSKNLKYDLVDISKYKTPYVGDNSKVSAIVGKLPVADKYFKQQYISMKTSEKPYSLTVYYEPALGNEYKSEWPIVTPDSIAETNSRKNALVLFSMIDNLEEVTFAYRISQSSGKLDLLKYDTTFTFQRAAFEEKYGYLSILSKDLDLLENVLKEKIYVESKFTDAEFN